MQDYTIAENAHVFACWAAGRAYIEIKKDIRITN